jgi:NAD(P)H dehydrogenase (quinone)
MFYSGYLRQVAAYMYILDKLYINSYHFDISRIISFYSLNILYSINKMSRKAKIAVIIYSTWGHVAKLAEEVIKGLKEANVEYKVFQIRETLPAEVLEKMYANKAPISDLPIIEAEDLKEFEGFLFGYPSRFGRAPAQISAFFDSTGGVWASGALIGKFATIFTSAGGQHGGQESVALTSLPFFAHHGIINVPFGFQHQDSQSNLERIVGTSAYGAATISGAKGELMPNELDLDAAKQHGKYFGSILSKHLG